MTSINTSERPLSFFNSPVKATLNGTKTQTTVVLRVQPEWVESEENSLSASGWYYRDPYGKFELKSYPDEESFKKAFLEHAICPYGKIGDHIWIREEWKAGAWCDDGRVAIDYKASPELTKTPWIQVDDFGEFENYWAQWTDQLEQSGLEADDNNHYHWEPGKSPLEWNTADSMPRWASRIQLEITNTRFERLQDISIEDALAQGIERIQVNCSRDGIKTAYRDYEIEGITRNNPIDSFRTLWNKVCSSKISSHIHNQSWEQNPWIWVIDFKVIDIKGALHEGA